MFHFLCGTVSKLHRKWRRASIIRRGVLQHDASSLVSSCFFFSRSSPLFTSSQAGESHEVGKSYTHPVGEERNSARFARSFILVGGNLQSLFSGGARRHWTMTSVTTERITNLWLLMMQPPLYAPSIACTMPIKLTRIGSIKRACSSLRTANR